jgi:argininosuccinate lyase
MKTLWQKQEGSGPDREWFDAFSATEDRLLDNRLVPYDIWTNVAHAQVLRKSGVLTESETETLLAALDSLRKSDFEVTADDEDVHSAVEKHLTSALGDLGKKIHTARSRNDQILTDLRLYERERLLDVVRLSAGVTERLTDIGRRQEGIAFAGITHMQPAMPTSADAWALGYADLFLENIRQSESAYRRLNRNPLGSAAGYGVPHIGIDRSLSADLLGFDSVLTPVAAAQLSRGLDELVLADVIGYQLYAAQRLASDLVWMFHPSVGWISLSEDQTSGSSIMPQKRNPDALELIRGAWHEAAGLQQTIRMMAAGLPSGYHRDLQLLKKATFALTDLAERVLNALIRSLEGLSFDATACARSITPDVTATHHANRLVRGGMPFRDAYRQTRSDLEAGSVAATGDALQAYANPGEPGRPVWPDVANAMDWAHAAAARIESAERRCFRTL